MVRVQQQQHNFHAYVGEEVGSLQRQQVSHVPFCEQIVKGDLQAGPRLLASKPQSTRHVPIRERPGWCYYAFVIGTFDSHDTYPHILGLLTLLSEISASARLSIV